MITLRYNSIKKELVRKALRLYSTSVEPASKQTEESYDKEIKKFETLTNITKRTRQKKPQRPPFVKNLLVGSFDTEILVYPQLDNDELRNLARDTNTLETLLKQKHMVKVDSLSNKSFRQNLSDVQAIGLQASQFLDGRESTPFEVIKYLQTFSEHSLGDSIINNEQLGVQTLVKYGSETQQKKYLYPVMKGDKLFAFCLTEEKLLSSNSIQTTAQLSKDGKHWLLNGKKSYIVNGVSADYLIVVAVTHIPDKRENNEQQLSVFIVEKDFPGVKWSKLDCDSCELAEIVFQDTQVPVENVIGEVNKGDEIISKIVSDYRLSCGAACSTLSKNIINKFLQTIFEESTDASMLYKTQSVRDKLGKLAVQLYASESVTYLTAGLQDWYHNQDVLIESAITKVISSEVAYKTSEVCLETVGLPAVFKDHWARKYHNKAIDYLTLHETNESQKMFIALMGLQYAGVQLADKIKKLRNPLFNATLALTRIWTNRKNINDCPDLDLGLNGYLHPSLQIQSEQLEYCVKRLEFAAEKILSRYGLDVVNKHVDLQRLADVMIDCYAMTAVLGRASRSYCIGLQNSDLEILLASIYCHMAKERVKNNVLALYSYHEKIVEKNILDTGKQLTKIGHYFAKNPLTRNF